MPTPLRVLLLVSEADPLVKIGGLGDVGGSLPPALRKLAGDEIDVRLVIPFHGTINSHLYPTRPVIEFDVSHNSGPIHARVYETSLNGEPIYLLGGDAIPPSAPVYSNDLGFDAHKYVFFSMAALEFCRVMQWQPDIIHANDWHTAAAIYAISLRRPYDTFFQNTATIMAVHNLPYLGIGANLPLAAFGLPPAYGSRLPEWAIHMPLPLGLLSADHILAVSPGYAKEILTPEFGSGLHEFLQSRKDSVSGILNGIDLQRWDPANDPALTANYESATLAARAANKIALQQEVALPVEPPVPGKSSPALLSIISRMDYQKGIDLAIGALTMLADLPWKAIILGTGHFELEAAVRTLEQNMPQRLRAIIRFDPSLSRRIYAGSDMLLMPSRYEPCGLAQMIAMRYGCIPVARATGGLKDTIVDGPKNGTGFLFTEATPEAMAAGLRRAILAYEDSPGWQQMQLRGMQFDFSWERSAKEYLQLYKRIKK
ncbi:MAG: glycogen synthase [Chloroflexota bacterium]